MKDFTEKVWGYLKLFMMHNSGFRLQRRISVCLTLI